MKVRVKIPQKRLQMLSDETFETIESVKSFIQKSIDRQYILCIKGWGLVSISETEINNVKTVVFSPACIALGKPLKVIFEIINQNILTMFNTIFFYSICFISQNDTKINDISVQTKFLLLKINFLF